MKQNYCSHWGWRKDRRNVGLVRQAPGSAGRCREKYPRLADNSPSFEAVVGQKPELVLAQYHWHIGPQGEVGTREQFASLGINTWISPADCTDKAVTEKSNADGARSAPFSLAEITREVTDLATIFDVSARGEQLNHTLTERIKRPRRASQRNRFASYSGSQVAV